MSKRAHMMMQQQSRKQVEEGESTLEDSQSQPDSTTGTSPKTSPSRKGSHQLATSVSFDKASAVPSDGSKSDTATVAETVTPWMLYRSNAWLYNSMTDVYMDPETMSYFEVDKSKGQLVTCSTPPANPPPDELVEEAKSLAALRRSSSKPAKPQRSTSKTSSASPRRTPRLTGTMRGGR